MKQILAQTTLTTNLFQSAHYGLSVYIESERFAAMKTAIPTVQRHVPTFARWIETHPKLGIQGIHLLKQLYTEEGSPLRSYHYGAGEVISEKMFGFHGRKDEGREGNLRTRGGLLYYGYDAIGNVTDLSDHLGNEVIKYRYDAVGGLYTGITAPYNTQGYTGQTYDPKSRLLDYNARWYSAKAGRFTSRDSFQGFLAQPQTQNLYSYVSNNPMRYTDPTGHWQDGDENLPPSTQLQIIDLTEQWFSTDDQAERDRLHQEAENLRNGGGTSTGSSGSSGSSSSGSGSSGGSSSSGGYESRPTFEQQLAVKLNRLAQVAGQEFAAKVSAAIYSVRFANNNQRDQYWSSGEAADASLNNVHAYIPLDTGGGFVAPTWNTWDRDNGLNWLINQAKIGWAKTSTDEERSYYASLAAEIRNNMRQSGVQENDIMQVEDPAVEQTLQRIEELNPSINAFVTILLTSPTNLTGHPSLTIPAGLSAAGLPIGIQPIGRQYSEPTLYRAAFTFDSGVLS